MKRFRLLVLVVMTLCYAPIAVAQSNIEEIIQEGIQYHDDGDYEKAIETYKKALKITPTSTLANYEIALSYFTKGDYKEAVQYADYVLKQKADLMLQAYTIKGNSLDMLGKTKESIKLFEKAIEQTGGNYLLFYNLALNHFKINDLDNAALNAISAIESNPNHGSSHLLLANIQNLKGNPVQTLLAAHYFLFLEPNTNRSQEAYLLLQKNFGGNVTKDPATPNTINIMLLANENSQFGAAEMMISMLEATKSLEENKSKTDDEMFVENTGSFFSILGELKTEEDKEIWWTFYTPFFYDLAKSEHMETYCKYITQSKNETSKTWLSENETKLDAFDNWLKGN
jgi:Tfp pilus assembly protein PilF